MSSDHRHPPVAAARALSRVTLLAASCVVVATATWFILAGTPPTGRQFMLIQLCASLAGAAGVTAYAHRPTMTRQILAATGANILACGMFVAAHLIRPPADPGMVPKFGNGVLPILFVSALGLGVAALPGCAVGLVWSALLQKVTSAGATSRQRSAT